MDYFFNFEKTDYLRGKRPEGCILCKVGGKDPEVCNLTVYTSEFSIVSLNLYPYNAGHVLVFPNKHYLDIREIDEQTTHDINKTIRLTLDVLDNLYSPAGYNIGCNMGREAGASIDHLHWHIIPRYPREIGIAELLAGKRVLVEHPLDSIERIRKAFIDRTLKI